MPPTFSSGGHTLSLSCTYSEPTRASPAQSSALVQGGSSTANLHEPHQHSEQGVHLEPVPYRASKVWDGVVRVGSLCLNHPDVVQKHPTHEVLP